MLGFRTVLLSSLTILLVGPGPARAQRIDSPYEFVERKRDIGPLVGYLFTNRGEADFGPKSSLIFGIQGTLRLSGPLSLSAILAYVPSERDVRDLTQDSTQLVTAGTVEQDLILVGGRLNLNLTGARTWHNLIPYLIGGLGFVFDATSDPSCLLDLQPIECQPDPRLRFDFGTSLMGQFGFGTVWLPSQRLGLRLELVDDFWRLETPAGFFDEGVMLNPVPPDKDWTNNFHLTGTLSLWL